jgi:hypothetical protein
MDDESYYSEEDHIEDLNNEIREEIIQELFNDNDDM